MKRLNVRLVYQADGVPAEAPRAQTVEEAMAERAWRRDGMQGLNPGRAELLMVPATVLTLARAYLNAPHKYTTLKEAGDALDLYRKLLACRDDAAVLELEDAEYLLLDGLVEEFALFSGINARLIIEAFHDFAEGGPA